MPLSHPVEAAATRRARTITALAALTVLVGAPVALAAPPTPPPPPRATGAAAEAGPAARGATPASRAKTRALTPAVARTATLRSAASALRLPVLERFVWVPPVSKVTQSSPFGMRWGRLHAGLDFAGEIGTPLKAMSAGTVTFAGQQSGYGTKVDVTHWDGTVAYYGHMHSIAVRAGQVVSPGTTLGTLGNTGRSTGPHLHLEVHPGGGSPIDPSPWLKARGIHP